MAVVRAGDSPVVAVAAHGHHVHGNSPLVAPAARANFLRKNVASPRAPAICPPDVALAMHAGDLPTVAFSARGHRERDDSPAVPLATRDSYSPDVALTGRR